MSSIKGETLSLLMRFRFLKSKGEILCARSRGMQTCVRAGEVNRRIEKVARRNCKFARAEHKEMTSGDGHPSCRAVVTRGDDNGLNIDRRECRM